MMLFAISNPFCVRKEERHADERASVTPACWAPLLRVALVIDASYVEEALELQALLLGDARVGKPGGPGLAVIVGFVATAEEPGLGLLELRHVAVVVLEHRACGLNVANASQPQLEVDTIALGLLAKLRDLGAHLLGALRALCRLGGLRLELGNPSVALLDEALVVDVGVAAYLRGRRTFLPPWACASLPVCASSSEPCAPLFSSSMSFPLVSTMTGARPVPTAPRVSGCHMGTPRRALGPISAQSRAPASGGDGIPHAWAFVPFQL